MSNEKDTIKKERYEELLAKEKELKNLKQPLPKSKDSLLKEDEELTIEDFVPDNVTENKKADDSTYECSNCGENIKKNAKKCHACEEEFDWSGLDG